MNTYPEHIGNELGKLTDKDLHRVLLQYVEKNFDSVQDMLNHLKLVAECEDFDYLGQIDDKKLEEVLGKGEEFSMKKTIVKPVEFKGKKFSNYYQTYNGHDVYHTCVVLTEPNIHWEDCQVKDLETQKEFLCSKKYILDHELKDENIRTIFVGNKTQDEITNWIKSNTKLGTIYAAFEGGVDAEILIINESLADLYLPNGERKINIPLEDVAKKLKEITLNKQQVTELNREKFTAEIIGEMFRKNNVQYAHYYCDSYRLTIVITIPETKDRNSYVSNIKEFLKNNGINDNLANIIFYKSLPYDVDMDYNTLYMTGRGIVEADRFFKDLEEYKNDIEMER